jgi:serralysin
MANTVATTQVLDQWQAAVLRYANPSDRPLTTTVTTQSGQAVANPLLAQRDAVQAMSFDVNDVQARQAALDRVVDMADGTTTVALMNYQFFTGRLPTQLGLDNLVNSPFNATDLNDGYYAGMTTENRYINFAVNLGKLGAGQPAFQAGYGALDLTAATTKAYAEIFGVAPTAAKVADILTPARQAYFNSLGGDATGAKAAMVGWLLAEAAKADVGPYSVMAENFLYDAADGFGAYGADAHIYLNAGPRSVGVIGV